MGRHFSPDRIRPILIATTLALGATASVCSGAVVRADSVAFYPVGNCEEVAACRSAVVFVNGASIEFWDPVAPGGPVRGSVVPMKQGVWSLASEGDYTYVSVSADSISLQVFDHSDITAVRCVAQLPSFPGRLSIAGGALYAYNNFDSTRVYSLADPAHPVVRARMIRTRLLAGARNTVCTYSNTFHVFDTTDPFAPVESGTTDVFGFVQDFEVSADANWAYVSTRDFYVVDLRNPDSLSIVSTSTSPRSYRWIRRAGPHLFAVGSEHVDLLDVTDPFAPQVRDRVGVGGFLNGAAGFDTASVLVAANRGPEWLTVDPAAHWPLTSRGRFPAGEVLGISVVPGPAGAAGAGVAGAGVVVLTANGRGGLRRWVGDAGQLIEAEPVFGIGVHAYRDVAPLDAGAFLAAASSLDGVDVIDMSTPGHDVVGNHSLMGSGESMTEGDGVLFVSQGRTGSVSIVDVSTPTAPSLASTIITPAYDVGPTAYASGFSLLAAYNDVANEVVLYDVANPRAPAWEAAIGSVVSSPILSVGGNVLYAGVADSVTMFELVPPYRVLGSFGTTFERPVRSFGLWSPGGGGAASYLIAATGGGLEAFDVSNPAAVKSVVMLPAYYSVMDVVVCGDHVFAVSSSGIEAIAMSVATPVAISAFRARAVGGAVRLRWEARDEEPIAGFNILRADRDGVPAASPGHVVRVGGAVREFVDRAVLPGRRYGYTVVARDRSGRETRSPERVVRVPRASTRLIGNSPNPFGPSTRFAFEIARAGRVELTVYSASGARVARVVSAHYPPGRHDVAWNGTDDQGHRVPAGVYFYRMRALGRTFPGKLVVAP